MPGERVFSRKSIPWTFLLSDRGNPQSGTGVVSCDDLGTIRDV